MKKISLYLSIFLVCFLIGCQNDELLSNDNNFNVSEVAELWFEQNHNLELNKNLSFYGNPDWDSKIKR